MHILIWLLIVIFSGLGGCDQARNKFDRVHLGMAGTEAVRLLGEPQERESTVQGDLLRWRLGDKTLVLQISKDRVIGKQLADAAGKTGKKS